MTLVSYMKKLLGTLSFGPLFGAVIWSTYVELVYGTEIWGCYILGCNI